jgi:hypothetical protein
MKSGFMNELSPEFTRDLVERFEPDNDRQNIVLLNQQAGAIADLAPDATAYNHREAQFDMMIGCVWDNPDHNEKNVAWGRSYFKAMSSYTTGYYVNNAMDESANSVGKNYQGNQDRLVELKNKYDPTNQFRLNANILPSV